MDKRKLLDSLALLAMWWGGICGAFGAIAFVWVAISPAFGFADNVGLAAGVVPWLLLGFGSIVIAYCRRIDAQLRESASRERH